MKATPQKFKISVEQEILYGEWMKKSAIEMGQEGKLPNAKQLAEQMGLNSTDHARNFIQRLIRDGRIERTNNPTTGCYPYKGYKIISN